MASQRKALGRGLDALLQGSSTPVAQRDDENEHRDREILLDLIDVNPEQPRRFFDEDNLDSLAESIRQHGVIQPVVVRQVGERYELQVGERRWRASQIAGLKTIPAVIADIAPADRLEIALIENIQRNDLNSIELALSFRELQERGHTQEEIGKRVGLERSTIANHIRLLDLSRDLQEDVERDRLSMGHAKVLLSISNPERRLYLRNKIVSQQLSVRRAEELGRAYNSPEGPARKGRASGKAEVFPDFRDALRGRLKTRIRIVGGKDQGKIEISYSSAEDLHRIGSLLLDGEDST